MTLRDSGLFAASRNRQKLPDLSWKCYSRSSIGSRQFQEDAHAVARWGNPDSKGQGGIVVAIADGMGGYAGGAAAARTAVTAALDSFLGFQGSIPEKLRTACQQANEAVAVAKDSAGVNYANMGCTLVLFCLYSNFIHWVSVGDSVLWILRKKSLIRLNADHSMRSRIDRPKQNPGGGSMVEVPAGSRNMLLSALTGSDLQLVDEDSDLVNLQAGDLVVAATDGVLVLEEPEITDTYIKSSTIEGFLDGLLSGVRSKAGNLMDNTTIIICQAN